MSEPRDPTPQQIWGCVCPSWSTARQCYCLRYAPDDSEAKDEVCKCACHDYPEDDDDDFR